MNRRQLLDGVRAAAHQRLGRVPGRLGDRLRDLNRALGLPLASAQELAAERDFADALARDPAAMPARAAATPGAAGAAATPGAAGAAAPVVVYHLDKHRSQLSRLLQPLDAAEIPYRILNLEGDPATQEAVRRDAGGRKLPLVFVAGECVGGREELHELDRKGLLRKKVWG